MENIHIDLEAHKRYFLHHLSHLPHFYTVNDANRVSMLYFALAALDLLDAIDLIPADKKDETIAWIYSLQITAPNPRVSENPYALCGFRGSPAFILPRSDQALADKTPEYQVYDGAHIANTYTALLCLIILGDDLSRVDKAAILKALVSLQYEDGSFSPSFIANEMDIRFVYCACAICYILNDFTTIDTAKITSFIRDSMSYDFAFGQNPSSESHGGSTYCALGALSLIQGGLNERLSAQDRLALIDWLVRRQRLGFHGRINKFDDTCYSFWIGASLQMLASDHLINQVLNVSHLASTQNTQTGGFGKSAGYPSDILHSYFGIAALSVMKFSGLLEIYSPLDISYRAFSRFRPGFIDSHTSSSSSSSSSS